MKILLYSLFTICFLCRSAQADNGNKVSQINALKKQAEQAFQKQDYQNAATLYQTLLDQYGVTDAQLLLNLAHAYFRLGDTQKATNYYQSVATETDKAIASVANQQLAVLEKENTEKALQYCKKALQLNPANEDARFNYELLKKKAEQERNQQNKDKNNDKNKENKEDNQQNQKNEQNKQDNQQQNQQKDQQQNQQDKKEQQSDSKDGQQAKEQEKQGKQEGKESKEEKERKDKQREAAERQQRLQNINMNEEKARMILDALKNNEVQYYQQYNRKPTKKTDKSKPDW